MAGSSSSPQVQVRALTSADDLDAQLDLNERAFGVRSPEQRDRWRQAQSAPIEQGRWLGAFVAGRQAGGAMFHDMRQWWCGRAVPAAGVSAVRVAPEDRGRGVGRLLMTALLEEVAARGYPLSALYPATMPLYRSLGWELAGGWYTAQVPARSLRALQPAGVSAGTLPELRRATPGDAGTVISIVGRVHEAARDCGPVTWDTEVTARWLTEPGLYAYLCDDGFLAYRWHNANSDLLVEAAHGASPATVRALWTHVASFASVAENVHARVGPADAFWWLTRERDAYVRDRSMWMLRVVDAAAAVAARGFPAAVSLTVPLLIADDARPANSGRWELTVAGGKGALTPATSGPVPPSGPVPSGTARAPLALDARGLAATGRAPLALGARGLAALYAGTPVVALRRAGLASGGSPDDDAALDAAFTATPYMLDSF